MKLKLPFFVLPFLLLHACTNDGAPGNGETEDPEPRKTIITYWIADNGSSDLSVYAKSDFNEMVEGMRQVDTDRNNLLVYCETIDAPPHLIRVKKKNGSMVADTIETYSEQNPLNAGVMSSIMKRIIAEFPAETYGLIIASHGDGWFKAPYSATPRHIGDYRGSQMDITDLRTALEDLPKFEFLLFDACYMQAIEVAYELRDYADYIISSPTEIPGPGAPYQQIVPVMFQTHANVPVDMGRGYYSYYGNEEGKAVEATYIYGKTSQVWNYGVSISVLKTSGLETLAGITQELMHRYIGYNEVINASSIFYYGSDSSGSIYYHDFGCFIKQITGGEGNEDYERWKAAFNSAQPYFQTTETNYVSRVKNKSSYDMRRAEGVSIYIPRNGNSAQHEYYRSLGWYDACGWADLGW